jgi:hypothetical protein
LDFVIKMIGFGGRASKTTKSPTAAEEAALTVLGCSCPPPAFSLVVESAGGGRIILKDQSGGMGGLGEHDNCGETAGLNLAKPR